MFSTSGAILAGGQSRRMGQDKAALVLAGETLLARAVRIMREVTPDLAIIGPPERAALAPGVPVLPDRWPNAGPLGGIATALQEARRLQSRLRATPPSPRMGVPPSTPAGHAPDQNQPFGEANGSAAVLVVGCDMPFLNVALLRYLVELAPEHEAVVVRVDGRAHPLHTVYQLGCLPVLEEQLAAGDLRVQHFLARLQARYVEPPELDRYDPTHRSVFNANTPEEWAEVLRVVDSAGKA